MATFAEELTAFNRNLAALDLTLEDIASFMMFGAPTKPTDEQIDRDAREYVEGRARAVESVELARVA